MKDIAKRCGVSTATVSKALNGQPDIGEETRERIVRIADEMGYMANASARALKTNRSYNIGVVFVDPMHGGLAHEFFSTVLDGIRSEAEGLGTTAAAKLIEQIEHPLTVILDRVIVTGSLQEGSTVKQL